MVGSGTTIIAVPREQHHHPHTNFHIFRLISPKKIGDFPTNPDK
jgi:hypothetical protein